LSQILANPKAVSPRDIAKFLIKLSDEAGFTFVGWHKNRCFLVSSKRSEMPEGQQPSLLELIVMGSLEDGQWSSKKWKANVLS
jgi:hypothetical protein